MELVEILSEIVDSSRFLLLKNGCRRCNTPIGIKPGGFCERCSEINNTLRERRKQVRMKQFRKTKAYAEFKRRRNAQVREKLARNPQLRLIKRIRDRIRVFIKAKGFVKLQSTKEMLGCDYPTLKLHIESQFVPGMSWENMGEWHIDHKKPLSKAQTNEDVILLNHYTNLQPLWALENISKGRKYNYVAA